MTPQAYGDKAKIFLLFFLAIGIVTIVRGFFETGTFEYLYALMISVNAAFFVPAIFLKRKKGLFIAAVYLVGLTMSVLKDPGDFSGLILLSYSMSKVYEKHVLVATAMFFFSLLAAVLNINLHDYSNYYILNVFVFLISGIAIFRGIE